MGGRGGAALGNILHSPYGLSSSILGQVVLLIPGRFRGRSDFCSGAAFLRSSRQAALSLSPPLSRKVLRVHDPRDVLIELKDPGLEHRLQRVHEVVQAAELVDEGLQELLVLLDDAPDDLRLADIGEGAREDGPTLLVDVPSDAGGHGRGLVAVRRRC